MITQVAMSPMLYDTVYMRGGWDLSTPTLELYAGVLRDVQNFEVSSVVAGGYSRIAGYERFDGRPSPTDATFQVLQLVAFESAPALDQVITGVTSLATGVVIVVTATYLVVTKVTGTFLNTETITKPGPVTVGILTPVDIVLSAKIQAQYRQLAADEYRADIVAVPGSGPVRGVVGAIFSGVDNVYAFRNNAGGTAVDIYKSSAGGWVNVPLYREISFTNAGPGIPLDGDTLTETAGGETATVKRVVLESGSFPSSINTGRFIITTPAPSEFEGGAATVGAGAIPVTLDGPSTAITLSPNGTFEFDVDNLSGQNTTRRIYGCDGINRGFEFDGDTLVPVKINLTGSALIPTHVAVHQLHLMFSVGSSIMHSGPTVPYQFSAAVGGGEIAVGDTITNFIEQPGNSTTGAIAITTLTDTLMLYGKSLDSWNLVPFNSGVGGIPFTGEMLNQGYWMAPHGVVDLHTTLNYGNFKAATITTNVESYIADQRSKVAYSVLNRTKNQYRILFTDKQVLAMTIVNGKLVGITKFLYTDQMHCAWNSTRVGLNERVLYGATATGHVYEADRGSSFDGAAIDAFLVFNWNAIRSPRMIKRYHRASLEVQGDAYAEFAWGYNLGYGSPEVSQPESEAIDAGITGSPFWDSFAWDSFVWDGVTLIPAEIKLKGTGVNIQPTITVGTNYIHPFTINSMILHHSNRRRLR